MATIDLNCDLGEGFGAWEMGNDAAMIELATSVNVACGFHAGDADIMRHTVELAQQFRGSVRTPESMFLVVSRALDASPQIELARISWHYGRVPAAIGADLTQPGTGEQHPLDPGTVVQTGVLRGEVTPFDGDYKAAMRVISAFAIQLAADDKVAEVRTLKLPLNVSSDTGLSGSTNAPSQRGSAQFEIAIVFKAGA